MDKTSLYVGATVNTPISSLKAGVAYDYVFLGPNTIGGPAESSGYQNVIGLYLNWQATEKLAFNTRGEYFSQSGYMASGALEALASGLVPGDLTARSAFELTETIQYDLWKNVIARGEFRWDHAADANAPFDGTSAGTGTRDNAFLLAANVIFKF